MLNRQNVTVSFNPMDLTRAAPESALTMPLFIALFVAFFCGVCIGYLLGYFGQNKSPALPVTPRVIKPSQGAGEADTSTKASVFSANKALSGQPIDRNGDESETSDEIRKSDVG